MTKTKRIALIFVSCVLVVAAVVGVSFAIWSNLESERVFTLKAGSLELNISSFDIINSDETISFDRPVEMSFKVKVEGEKSTLSFSVDSFQYSLVEGEYLPLNKDLFKVEVPKKMYGIGGEGNNDTITCVVKVSLTDVYDYDSFDPVLMGKKFRFNIRVTAETYKTPTQYDIIYHNTDDAVNENITNWSVETNYTFLPASRVGYTFKGWYTDASLSDEYKITELVQDDPNIANLNIYAKWEVIKYSINYNFGSGMSPVNMPSEYDVADVINFNDAQYKPTNADPTLLFGGYYEDENFTTRLNVLEKRTGNITLYVKWVQQYNIIYNDALGAVNNNPTVFSALDGEITLSDLTKDGYTFDGWYNAEEIKVTTIDTLTESNIELTAKWTANKYGITWDYAEGNAIADIITEYTYGANTDISGYVPTRDGYDFEGWYLDGNKITAIPADTINAITITSQWTIVNYDIMWHVDGGILAQNTPITYTIDDSVSPSDYAPTKNGYTFDGWYTDSSLNNPASTIEIGTTGAKEFYAKWTANKYGITWDYAEGNAIADIITEYTYGANTDISGYVPTRDGYDFAGWYLDGNMITTIPADTMNAITITAQWTIVNYDITWHVDGGTLAQNTPITYTIVDSVDPSLYIPTKDGYTFDGWYTDSGLSVNASVITSGTTGAKEFYAKWSLETYDIVVELNGGLFAAGESIPNRYDVNTQTITLSTPTKSGYNFLGWYTSSDFSGVSITEIATGSTGNVNLYAKWDLATYNIAYNGGFGAVPIDMPQTYTIEDTIILTNYTPTPVLEGYVFEGYYLDDAFMRPISEITPNSMTGDITIYLNWTAPTV